MCTHKGQSTVEYILLITAVITVIILFTTNKGPGTFQGGLNQVFNESTQDMLNVASRLGDNAASSSGTGPPTLLPLGSGN